MNLEESNEFIKEQDSKKRKKNIILGLIIMCIILIVVLIAMISFLKIEDANTSKLYVNGDKIKFSKTLFLTQDDITYISAKEISQLVGYNYESGEYKKYNEDENYCYLQNDYEVISIAVDSNIIKKYLINANDIEGKDKDKTDVKEQEESLKNTDSQQITFTVKSNNDTMELFELSDKVVKINDEIYVPINDASKIFNIMISVDNKTTYIYNLLYLYQRGVAFATQYGYDEISSMYENVRAIVDNILIVKDSKGKYGAISMEDRSQILGMKYSNIQYIQNTEEFFVYTDDTVGLIDKTGKKTIIQPTEYDDLAVFDEINKLYIAQKDGVYGILDRKGNEIIPVTYDSIGLTSFVDFELPDTETPNILEDKFIIVTENEKFGLYTIDGERLLRSIYDSFGYIQDSEDKKSGIDSVLIVPKSAGIHGLVIKQNDFFGIYDLDSKDIIIPCSLNKIYSKVESGELNYYMISGEDIYNIKEFFDELNSSNDHNQNNQDPDPEPDPEPEPEEPIEPEEPEDHDQPSEVDENFDDDEETDYDNRNNQFDEENTDNENDGEDIEEDSNSENNGDSENNEDYIEE